MTIRLLNQARNSEMHNAQALRKLLLNSEPELDEPNVRFEIVASAHIPGRQLDLVLIFEDNRAAEHRFKTTDGTRIDSFVLILEVKNHSSDQIKFQGNRLLVQYKSGWHDASDQSDGQKFAFKDYQKASYYQSQKRHPAFIHNAIWLPRVASQNYGRLGGVNVYFSDFSWQQLIEDLFVRPVNKTRVVSTLVSTNKTSLYYSFDNIVELLTKEVVPTKLDQRKIKNLSQTRFDEEKTKYIQNLGTGLLMLTGRGGTGKTFSMVQLGLFLAKKGFSSVILTFNHGLISEISRQLRLISAEFPEGQLMPEIMTRYRFLKLTAKRAFEKEIVSVDMNLDQQELIRTEQLLKNSEMIAPSWDYVLIDEGQDWLEIQRDLIYKIFSPEKTIVAHGVDQFVTGARCKWDMDSIPINRRHGLRLSQRTKGSTCITIAHIARKLGMKNWDLEADPAVYGGRVTVYVEPNGPLAIRKAIKLLQDDLVAFPDVKPIDNLICFPDTTTSSKVNFSALFDKQIAESSSDSWRGFDEDDRRLYPTDHDQIRAVLYQSCRGMEGWGTVCIALDQFYHSQFHRPIQVSEIEVALRLKHGLLFESEMVKNEMNRMRKLRANQWTMIPLTRSVDHLIIHLSDPDSYLGLCLRGVERDFPGSINWLE
jgi:hypothetical protein